MKKNEKGFMLTEILIVSTVTIGVLVFMYSQFRSINTTFKYTYRYNTVESIYKTNEIKKFIESDASTDIILSLNNSNDNYIDISKCETSLYNNTTFCKLLYEKVGATNVLLLSENVTRLINSDMNGIEPGMQNFIKYVNKNYTGNYYRVVVKYDDDTYCTLKLDILNHTYDFAYTGTPQTFTVPANGYYQVELWGADGGNAYENIKGGKGGYTKGKIYLEKGTKLYTYVGGTGSCINRWYATLGGYNGGGIAYGQDGTVERYFCSGGGATDIRLVNGNWDNFESLKSRIMVAAGGGGSFAYSSTSGKEGGSGGGLTGSDGESYNNGWGGVSKGATQTEPGYSICDEATCSEFLNRGYTKGNYYYGKFGYASQSNREASSGGGSGYYGSGTTIHVQSAGGGSSYISGHEGCVAILSTSTDQEHIYHSEESDLVKKSTHYSQYKFTNTRMIDGEGFEWKTSKQGQVGLPIVEGRNGNGYARITLLEVEGA